MTKDELEVACATVGWVYQETLNPLPTRHGHTTHCVARDPVSGYTLASAYVDDRNVPKGPLAALGLLTYSPMSARMAREAVWKRVLERVAA